MASARVPRPLGQLVDLLAVDTAAIGEEQQVRVGRGDEQVLDVVVVLERRATKSLAPAPLGAVRRDGQSLDVSAARDRDNHLLLGDEVLKVDLALARDDFRTSFVGEPFPKCEDLLPDDGHDPGFVTENGPQARDLHLELLMLVADGVAFELGEPLQAQVEDRARLHLGQREAGHQAAARLVGVGGGPDQSDDLVDVGECDE